MPPSAGPSLAREIIERVEQLLLEAEQASKPLEVDPYRGQLFELFVTAEGAGYVDDDADPDLTADGLCRALAERWGLAEATRRSFEQQARLPAEHVSRMRILWSLIRMWMEWEYAWKRWPEFHGGTEVPPSGDNGS